MRSTCATSLLRRSNVACAEEVHVVAKLGLSSPARPDLGRPKIFWGLAQVSFLFSRWARFWWSVMTFFQKFRCQIGPPTLRAMGIPRTPPESRLARWALGAARYVPTCDLCKVRICQYSYAVIHDAHQAKRDSGGVRGILIALSVGGPIWHRSFWKKVIRNPIADIGFLSKLAI